MKELINLIIIMVVTILIAKNIDSYKNLKRIEKQITLRD